MAVQTMTASEETSLDFKGDVDVNDNPPSQKDLDRAAELAVLDTKGQPHAFKSLYSQEGSRRTLIIFIRHFFCGVSSRINNFLKST